MTFSALCALLEDLRATRGRNEKVARTATFLKLLAPEEIRAAVAFLAGRPLPSADPRTLDASWALLSEAAGPRLSAGGPPKSRKRTRTPEHPSLPFEAPAAMAPPSAAPAILTLRDLETAFADVAAASGPGSRERKVAALAALFARADPREREALFGIVLGTLRTGVSEGLLLDAIAAAAGAAPDAVRRASLFLADPSDIAAVALSAGGAEALAQVRLTLFRPVLPMLASPADGLDEAWGTLEGRGIAVETKYDGVRIQVHRRGDAVRVWSRRLTELTASVPEAVTAAHAFAADEVILDGEVLAKGEDGKPLPFEEVMRRLQRDPALGSANEIPLELRFFDCLMSGGAPLVDEPYSARWDALARVTSGAHLAARLLPASREEAAPFLARALAEGHEGLVAKALDSRYEPGRRGKRWLKLKVPGTLDCVIVAADRGSGRRSGWLSNHHLAVRDGRGGFVHVGKTFKGLTDAEHRGMTERLRAIATGDDGYTVFVRPQIVVEVTYNEIQPSRHLSSGFALRFARVTRIRDDKRPEDADTLEELRDRYERQFAAKSRPKQR